MGVAATSQVAATAGAAASDEPRKGRAWVSTGQGTLLAVGGAVFSTSGASLEAVDASFGQNIIKQTTTATSGNASNARMQPGVRYSANPLLAMTFRVYDTSVLRQWVGLSGITSAIPGSDTAPVNSVLLRHSTNAGDTNWKLVTSDASTSTVTDTGLAVTSGMWGLELSVQAAAVGVRLTKFTANGTPSGSTYTGSITATLPVAATQPFSIMQVETLEAVAKSIGVARMWWSFDAGWPF